LPKWNHKDKGAAKRINLAEGKGCKDTFEDDYERTGAWAWQSGTVTGTKGVPRSVSHKKKGGAVKGVSHPAPGEKVRPWKDGKVKGPGRQTRKRQEIQTLSKGAEGRFLPTANQP